MKLLMIFILFVPIIAFSQLEKTQWDYPVKPGSEMWKSLKSYEEQLKAYNIPDDIIKKISTAELVKVCLAYPEWMVMNAFNDRRMGLANVASIFNGFHELFSRNDAAKELINVYSEMCPLKVDRKWTPLQQGEFSFQFTCIEMLMSHVAIINKLDKDDIRELLNEISAKYEARKQMPDIYSLWDLSPCAGLCLCVLDKDGGNKRDANVQSFKSTFMSEDIKLLDAIISESKMK